jgi:hypothetical protein
MGGQLDPSASDIIVLNDLAYVAHLASGLIILDVTYVIDPRYLYASGRGADLDGAGIDISNNYAYLGTENKGLRVFDVADPSNPIEVGYYITNGKAGRVMAKDGIIFLASGSGGLYILHNELVTSVGDGNREESLQGFQLFQNYPNPFNPTTHIQYTIPSKEHRAESIEQRGGSGEQRTDSGLDALRTTLKIYNILGQEVRVLVDGEREAGYHTVTWDGRNSAGNDVISGIYFYRIIVKADGLIKWTKTRRLVFMK